MKIKLIIIGLLFIMITVIGIASALDGVGLFARHGDEYWTRADYEGIGPVQDRVGLFARPGDVYPTPADIQVNQSGIRWERPVRPEWINQTSIMSGITRIDVSLPQPEYQSRLSRFL
jgi:hypothetical protein